MRKTDKELLHVPPEDWTEEKLQAAAQRLQEIVARHHAAREAKASKEGSTTKDLLDC